MGNSLLVTGNSLLVFTTPPCGHPSNGGELNTYHCGLNSPLWGGGTYSATGRKPSSPMRRGAGISGPAKMIIFVGDRPAGWSAQRETHQCPPPPRMVRNTSNQLRVTSNKLPVTPLKKPPKWAIFYFSSAFSGVASVGFSATGCSTGFSPSAGAASFSALSSASTFLVPNVRTLPATNASISSWDWAT